MLRRSVAAGRDAHAYLITGPPGIGKAVLALRLAQALNCEHPDCAPCFQCNTCRRIEHGNYPDVRIASMETQAAGLKAEEAARQKELKIGTVREWQRDITLRPYEGRRRVFILHDADYLNEEASNAMLKTLEEPPPFATMLLVANRVNLLPTIVSRCQMIRLRPLPRQQVTRALMEHASLSHEQATLLAAWSGGRIGWALRIAAAPEEIQLRQERLQTLLALHQQPRSAAFRWAEERYQEYRSGQQALVFEWLELWQSWWRDVLLVSAGCPESITHTDRHEELQREAERCRLSEVYAFVARLGETSQQLRENVNPQLALENVLLHLPA
jgi:DNA polymerase-3 subunit delta'